MRFAVFLLLGPPIGSLALLLLALPMVSLSAGEGFVMPPNPLPLWLTLMPSSYFFGFIPALLTAIVDGLLDRFGLQGVWRIGITALVGFVLSLAPLVVVVLFGFLHGPWLLLWGMSGFLAGSACSAVTEWLQVRQDRHRPPRHRLDLR